MFVRWTDKSGDDVVFDLENIATLRRRHTEIKAIDVCGETVTTTRTDTVEEAEAMLTRIINAKSDGVEAFDVNEL